MWDQSGFSSLTHAFDSTSVDVAHLCNYRGIVGARPSTVATLFVAVNHSSNARAFTPVTLRPFRLVRQMDMNTCKVW